MNEPRIHHAVRIARTEWTRHAREIGGPWAERPVRSVALLVATVVLGAAAYVVGRDLAADGAVPLGGPWIVSAVAFVSVVLRSARLTRDRFEQLSPELHLTAVPASVPALGLCCFVFARVAATLALPTGGVAVGVAVGLRSPSVALTVVVAVAGLTAVAGSFGTAGRLAVHLVGMRLARGGFYRDLLVVFGWVPLVALWLLLRETSVSIAPLLSVLETQPVAWFVDLALVGAGGGIGVEPGRALGALGIAVLAVPTLVASTTVLARRIWERDPTGVTEPHGSRSLVASGWSERLLGGRVSRPVLTVARVRWLRARRVPYGLLSIGYVLLFASLVLFPVFGILEVPTLLLFAVALGLAAGFAFGTGPIAVEYQGLPMLLTTVDGRQYVRGVVLAALAAAVPLVAVVVLPIGVVSPAGVAETIGIVGFGIAVAACTATVALAIGMDVERSTLVPVPFFFTDVPVYGELGTAWIRRMGKTFGIVSLAGSPAYLGNVATVYEGIAAVGIPIAAVRVSALLVGTVVVVGVSRAAYGTALRRYRSYLIG
ncbi:hypothetical protein [Natronorubrum sp. FCH18a]|uniref:hypothetical protein n=1 Tax=Natronorubrum sp. FCH18a TaxID=3447018 RepID=UPI003F514BFA